MVSELYLDLVSRKLDGIVLSDGMCRVQNGLFGLLENYWETKLLKIFFRIKYLIFLQIIFYLVEQIQLNWVAGVNVGVVVEVFALQQQNVDLCDTLFAKGFAMVHPMN